MSLKTKRFLIFGVVLLLLASLLAACGTPAPAPQAPSGGDTPSTPVKVKELRMQTYMTENSIFAKTFKEFAGDVIREQTNGEIDITLFTDSSLVPDKELFDAVETGVLDIAHTSSGRDAGKIGPIGNIALGMPYMWKNPMQAKVLFYELGLGDMLRQAYGDQGVYLVGPASGTGTDTRFWTKVPIRSLADFQNVKLRISGGAPAAALFSEFGVAPVSMGMGEIYTSLSTGVIDGASAGSTTSNEARAFNEQTKYIIKPGYIYSYSTQFIANDDVWKSLTPQQQHIIEIALQNWFYRADQKEVVAEGEAITRVKAAGMEIITLPESDVMKLAAAAQKGWDKAAGDDAAAKQALAIIKDFLRGQGYID